MRKLPTYRITSISDTGKRSVSLMSEIELQKFRAHRLKDLRKNDLELTQKELANAVGVNIRTLQDWERGRTSMPKPVEILLSLMKNMPSIKKRLTSKEQVDILAV